MITVAIKLDGPICSCKPSALEWGLDGAGSKTTFVVDCKKCGSEVRESAKSSLKHSITWPGKKAKKRKGEDTEFVSLT